MTGLMKRVERQFSRKHRTRNLTVFGSSYFDTIRRFIYCRTVPDVRLRTRRLLGPVDKLWADDFAGVSGLTADVAWLSLRIVGPRARPAHRQVAFIPLQGTASRLAFAQR